MSTFENNHYRWRETYFVLFASKDRPKLATVQKTLRQLDARYELANASADEGGWFESLTLISHDDFAALDICYTEGEEVREQVQGLVEELRPMACETGCEAQLQKIKHCDARFDVLHFEEMSESLDDDDDLLDDALDPSALLLVMAELARLTGGVAVDPQSGTILTEGG
ncbi:MAG: hypothetical protein RBS80_09300 [Thermoguttaceae bacterium]|jgi:hypothetical protein|nr:hypothetical protein [Thermoguttaceae bacterium]